MEILPIPELKYLLNKSYCEATSFTPEIWTKENPTYGHCAVTVLIAKNFLGGRIQRALVPKEWEERLGYPSHYWNVLENGQKEDLTRKQFPIDFPYDDFVEGKIGEQPDKLDKEEYLLSNSHTKERYELLKSRFTDLLNSEPLYFDKTHQRLWKLAFSGDTKCPRKRFACQVYDGNKLVTEEVNRFMTEQFRKERFCSLDGSSCIRDRLEKESRVDATLGDCGHSQIWALKNVFELGYKPSDLPKLDFYEAGFIPADFSPWWERKEPGYTCTYCENIFAVFGLDKSWGIYEKRWTPFYTKDSFYSAGAYALGDKKV